MTPFKAEKLKKLSSKLDSLRSQRKSITNAWLGLLKNGNFPQPEQKQKWIEEIHGLDKDIKHVWAEWQALVLED